MTAGLPPQPIPGITDLPAAASGMRVGLFGGSFNPAHEGHRLVAVQCLQRLELDAVWLLVSPGNPLKDHAELASLSDRVLAARAVMAHPAIEVTGLEAAKGFTYTYDTLRYIRDVRPGTRFVWIMGADNLRQFHRWERWQDIAALLPMAIYARPGSNLRATYSQAATALRHQRIPEAEAASIADREPPAWVYLHGMMSPLSSTAIRALRRQSAQSD